MAAAKQFIAANIRISFRLTDRSRPSRQFLVTLMANNRIEITTGKLNTAIRIWLLVVFDAMPDSNVSDVANPKEASTTTREKRAGS